MDLPTRLTVGERRIELIEEIKFAFDILSK